MTDQTAAPADAGGAQVTEEDLFAVRAITEEARKSGSGVYLQPDTVDRLLFSLAAREEAAAREQRLASAFVNQAPTPEEREWRVLFSDAMETARKATERAAAAREEATRWESRSNSMEDSREAMEERLDTATARAAVLDSILREMLEAHCPSPHPSRGCSNTVHMKARAALASPSGDTP